MTTTMKLEITRAPWWEALQLLAETTINTHRKINPYFIVFPLRTMCIRLRVNWRSLEVRFRKKAHRSLCHCQVASFPLLLLVHRETKTNRLAWIISLLVSFSRTICHHFHAGAGSRLTRASNLKKKHRKTNDLLITFAPGFVAEFLLDLNVAVAVVIMTQCALAYQGTENKERATNKEVIKEMKTASNWRRTGVIQNSVSVGERVFCTPHNQIYGVLCTRFVPPQQQQQRRQQFKLRRHISHAMLITGIAA